MKTGSTSIQTFFHENETALLSQGLYRPETGREDRPLYHKGLINSFMGGHASAPLANRLAAELEARDRPGKVFVTAEMFASRLGNQAYFANLKTFCRQLGYRPHVIAFIRPQAPLLNSLYTENVKNWRPVATIEAFIAKETAASRHRYGGLFSAVMDDADCDFTLLPFNRQTLTAGLETAMCKVMGLDGAAPGLIRPEAANPSPGPRTVAAFQRLRRRAVNEFPDLDQERLVALVWPLLRSAGSLGWNDTKFGGLSDALQAMIIDLFSADNAALAKRVWSQSWTDVFTEPEERAPAFNTFDPALATPGDRREFRNFLEESMATIREFATCYHGQGRRM